jgi:2-iminoacetate synthase ThiH
MDAGRKRELETLVYAGRRLSREDGVALVEGDDLAWLGRLAHHQRTARNGDRVLFRIDTEPVETDGTDETEATLSYGPGLPGSDLVDRLLAVREVQDETGRLVTFRPVPEPGAAPIESFRAFAVSRLLLDNVPHLGCSSAAQGRSVAQLCLNFGADDITGDDRDDLVELIQDAGFAPVERTGDFTVVREFDRGPSLAERRRDPQRIWA